MRVGPTSICIYAVHARTILSFDHCPRLGSVQILTEKKRGSSWKNWTRHHEGMSLQLRCGGRIRDNISYRRVFISYDLFCPQVDGANALTNMAKALATTFKSVRADNITKNILTGLNFVLDAAVATSSEIKREQGSSEIRDWIDDSNEARNKDHQEKVTIWSISRRPVWSDTLAILKRRC